MDIFSSARLIRLSPAQIDPCDRLFALDFSDRGHWETRQALDIREQGLLAPLWCQERAGGGYRVVDGFRRLEAARRTGLSELPVLVFPPEASPLELLRARLAGHEGGISAVQASRFLKKTGSFPGADPVVPDWFTRLTGAGGGAAQLDRLRSLDRLEEPLARWCSENRVGLAEAAAIAALSREDQDGLLVLLQSVNPTGNLLKRCLALITEISSREGIPVAEVLGDPALQAVFCDPQTARSAGRELVRRRLYELRYPELTALRERFAGAVKSLGLPATVHVEPPEGFEGDRVRVSFEFGGHEELEKIASMLCHAAGSDSARELFRCLGAPRELPESGEPL